MEILKNIRKKEGILKIESRLYSYEKKQKDLSPL